MKILTIFLITLFFQQNLIDAENLHPTIKEIRSSLGAGQDLIRVDLGISEKYPNTRIVFYVDVNNDK